MFITSTFSVRRSRSFWPYFHAPAILPYILKTILWINVTLGILILYDTTVDILTMLATLIYISWSSDFAIYLECYLSGVAMVSCILRHRGVQLKLAYSWARPAILVAGKGRGGMFLFLLFLHFHSCSYFFPNRLFHLLYYLFYLLSPFLWETTQNDPQGLTCR